MHDGDPRQNSNRRGSIRRGRSIPQRNMARQAQEPQRGLRTMSRDDVLQMALELKEDYGEGLTLTAFRRETGLSQHLIFDLFGNWRELRMMIGLTPMAPRSRKKFTNAQLVEHLKRLAGERGPNITQWEFCHAVGTSHAEIGRRFGSWGNLRVEAGLPRRIRRPSQFTDEQMLDDLLQVYLRVGFLPPLNSYKFYGGKISSASIRARFRNDQGVRIKFEIHRRKYMKQLRDETAANKSSTANGRRSHHDK